ncbi:MAG TPA: TonB-dependent receptor plug domain-containing protein [Gemmatimonadales bacterium]
MKGLPLTLLVLPLTLFALPLRAQIAADDTTTIESEQDTVNSTERYLKEQLQKNVRVPVMPLLDVEGPRPALTRVVFTRDSIEWGHAATVSDLLTQVPGVYLWRGGYIGRPEPVSFQGRGSASAEYYLDGVPYVPAGVDSLGVDPALFSISLLDRIEVERWPGQLRVHLFTKRHGLLAPRSRIGIARGDNDYARYEASLERRFRSGLGFGLAGDYLSSPTAGGAGSDYSNTQVWAQGSYIPSERFGVQAQLVRSGPKRDPYVTVAPGFQDTIGLGYDAKRTDAQIRVMFKGPGAEGLGPRIDLIYARTGWSGEGFKQQIDQIGGYLTYRAPSFSVTGSAFHRTRWTPLDARASLGWNPVAPFSARGELVHLHHFGGRSSDYANLSAGLELVQGLAVTGTARIGKVVAAPAIVTDQEQDVRDYQAALGWNRARLGFQVSYARTSPFAPPAYPEYIRIVSLAPGPRTEWITASARLAPLQWMTLEGWYSDPRGVTPDGVPPTHSLVAGTIRSKFLRKFPSGIFDLKLRLAMETWGTGVIGRDALGLPITLKGATFLRSLIQIQLDKFTIYWDRGNLTATSLPYVPGFEIPAYGSVFGVSWEFFN